MNVDAPTLVVFISQHLPGVSVHLIRVPFVYRYPPALIGQHDTQDEVFPTSRAPLQIYSLIFRSTAGANPYGNTSGNPLGVLDKGTPSPE